MKTRILLSSTSTKELLPAAPDDSVISSSSELWWGIKIEHHLLPPAELDEHLVNEHRLMINIGDAVDFEHKTGSRWKERTLRHGDFDLLSHHEMNHPRWHDTLNIMAIAIDPVYTAQILEQHNTSFHIRGGTKDPFMADLASRLLQEARDHNLAGSMYGDSLTITFIIHLASRYECNRKPVFAPEGKLSAYQLKHVIDYANSALDKNITLDALAAQANLSAFHFARLFKRSMGLSPYQFVLKLKLDRAMQLIKESEYSLTEIAYALGFTDQAHFSNAFKRATGLTPRQYMRA